MRVLPVCSGAHGWDTQEKRKKVFRILKGWPVVKAEGSHMDCRPEDPAVGLESRVCLGAMGDVAVAGGWVQWCQALNTRETQT